MNNKQDEKIDHGKRKLWVAPTLVAMGGLLPKPVKGGSCVTIGDLHNGWHNDNKGGKHGRW